MLKVKWTDNFDRMLAALDEESAEYFPLVNQKIKLFSKNPKDTRLQNHALKKRMRGKWAFSITDDIRIVYEWIGKESVRFLAIGIHEEVYQ